MTAVAQPADLWLVPTPRAVRPLDARHRLAPRLTYQGPDPATAFRVLHPVCRDHRITLLPGTPPPDLKGFATVDVREPARPLPAQGYRLLIDERSIIIEAPEGPGLRHALVTLAQLIRRFGRDLPALEIDDAPAFITRGVMLDVSRNRVPTMSSLFASVDLFESLKLNHLQLYTEHTFAYEGHEDAWHGASPITPDEARELDAYAERRAVALIANQNTLGHLAHWLRLPRYNDLAEIIGLDTEWAFQTPEGRRITRRGPFSLCPTDPGSTDFVRSLLDQLLPCFSTALVNIGCDEAYDIGQGRSRRAVQERGYNAVYLDHLRAVADIAAAHGKRAMFWADMALKSEAIGPLPDHSTALVWGYEHDEDFRTRVDRLRARAVPTWVCPGTSSWRSIVGRTTVRRANLARAAQCAGAAEGFLITDWGDVGHRQQWPVSALAIADGAARAWNPAAPPSPEALAFHALGDPSGALGPLMESLGAVDAALSERLALRNTNALFTELHRSITDPPAERSGTLDEWQAIRNRLAELRAGFEAAPADAARRLVRDEIDLTIRVAEHAADKAIVCRIDPGKPPRGAALIRLAADMGAIIEDQRALWPARSRRGGLDESVAHDERILEDYAAV